MYTLLCYVEAYPTPTKRRMLCQQKANEQWNTSKDDKDVKVKVEALVNELKAMSMKRRRSLLTSWGKQPTPFKEREMNPRYQPLIGILLVIQ